MQYSNGIELLDGWQEHLGKLAGGDNPAFFSQDINYPSLGRRLEIAGMVGKWCNALAYKIMPWVAGCQQLDWEFDVLFDSGAALANCFEFDTRFETPDGYDLNCSSQIVQSKGGKLQISNAAGSWVDTGYSVPITPATSYHFKYSYWYDLSTHTYGISRITITPAGGADQVYAISRNLQALAGQQLKWTSGIYIQVQLDTTDNGASFGHIVSNMSQTSY